MLTLAQVATDVAQHAADTSLGTGAILAIVTAEAIEMLKNSGIKRLQWIRADTAAVNRIVGGVVAFITGLGISITFDPTTGQAVISGLLAGSIGHGLAQWAQQQLYYRIAMARGQSAPAVVAQPVITP